MLIKVDDGELRFQGRADKVDRRRDGTLLVTDLKTGSIFTFKDLSETNPVAHGEKLLAAKAPKGKKPE